MKAVLMPALGVAMSEGLLLRWLRSPGDAVAEGEPLMEIETDKATMEIESPVAGVLGPLLFAPGAVVPVGTAMTHVIEASDGSEVASAVPEAEAPPSGTDSVTLADQAAHGPATVESGRRTPHQSSPRERRLARDRENATAVSEETEQPLFATSPTVAPSIGAPLATSREGHGRHRDLIAARVSESWRTMPHFAVTREVDAAAMMAVRERRRDERPGYTALMVKALALALREGGEPGAVDVGLAVATPNGVAIAVIRGVLALDLAGLLRETEAAISRARDGRLLPVDISTPPRSTLSNLGPEGVDSFTGVIAIGQASILTVGRIMPRPHVIAGKLSVRDSFIATLTVDHRVLDGDDAARLLMAFVGAVEDVERLERETALL